MCRRSFLAEHAAHGAHLRGRACGRGTGEGPRGNSSTPIRCYRAQESQESGRSRPYDSRAPAAPTSFAALIRNSSGLRLMDVLNGHSFHSLCMRPSGSRWLVLDIIVEITRLCCATGLEGCRGFRRAPARFHGLILFASLVGR